MQLSGCTHEWPFCLSKGHGRASLVCLSCEYLAKCCSYNMPLLCHIRINSAWHPAGLSELERLLPKHLLPKPTLDLTVPLASDSSFRWLVRCPCQTCGPQQHGGPLIASHQNRAWGCRLRKMCWSYPSQPPSAPSFPSPELPLASIVLRSRKTEARHKGTAIVWVYIYELSTIGKTTVMESRLLFAWTWGKRRMGMDCLMGTWFPFGVMRKFCN